MTVHNTETAYFVKEALLYFFSNQLFYIYDKVKDTAKQSIKQWEKCQRDSKPDFHFLNSINNP